MQNQLPKAYKQSILKQRIRSSLTMNESELKMKLQSDSVPNKRMLHHTQNVSYQEGLLSSDLSHKFPDKSSFSLATNSDTLQLSSASDEESFELSSVASEVVFFFYKEAIKVCSEVLVTLSSTFDNSNQVGSLRGLQSCDNSTCSEGKKNEQESDNSDLDSILKTYINLLNQFVNGFEPTEPPKTGFNEMVESGLTHATAVQQCETLKNLLVFKVIKARCFFIIFELLLQYEDENLLIGLVAFTLTLIELLMMELGNLEMCRSCYVFKMLIINLSGAWQSYWRNEHWQLQTHSLMTSLRSGDISLEAGMNQIDQITQEQRYYQMIGVIMMVSSVAYFLIFNVLDVQKDKFQTLVFAACFYLNAFCLKVPLSFFVLSAAFVYMILVLVQLTLNIESKLLDFVMELNQAIKNNHYYVSGIVHDLRNPISCLQLFFELLEFKLPMNTLDSEIRDMIHSCKKSSENVFIMVSNILDYQKMQNGNLEPNYQPENIFEVIKNVVDLHSQKAIQKGLKLFVYLDPNLIPILLLLDTSRTTQILNNLVSNAIKFTSSGGVSIYVSWKPDNAYILRNGKQQVMYPLTLMEGYRRLQLTDKIILNQQIQSQRRQSLAPKTRTPFYMSGYHMQHTKRQSSERVLIKRKSSAGLSQLRKLNFSSEVRPFEKKQSNQSNNVSFEKPRAGPRSGDETPKLGRVTISIENGSSNMSVPSDQEQQVNIEQPKEPEAQQPKVKESSERQPNAPQLEISSFELEEQKEEVSKEANSVSVSVEINQIDLNPQQEQIDEVNAEEEMSSGTSMEEHVENQLLSQSYTFLDDQPANENMRNDRTLTNDQQFKVNQHLLNIRAPEVRIQRNRSVHSMSVPVQIGETGQTVDSERDEKNRQVRYQLKKIDAEIAQAKERKRKWEAKKLRDSRSVMEESKTGSAASDPVASRGSSVQLSVPSVASNSASSAKGEPSPIIQNRKKSAFGNYVFQRGKPIDQANNEEQKQVPVIRRSKAPAPPPPFQLSVPNGKSQIRKPSLSSGNKKVFKKQLSEIQEEGGKSGQESKPAHMSALFQKKLLELKKQTAAIKAKQQTMHSQQRSMSVAPQQIANDIKIMKQIEVRLPRRNRRHSISIPHPDQVKPRPFPISRLNNYNAQLKKKRGSVCMSIELESIAESGQSSGQQSNPKSVSQDLNISSAISHQPISEVGEQEEEEGKNEDLRRYSVCSASSFNSIADSMQLNNKIVKLSVQEDKQVAQNNKEIKNFGHVRRNQLVNKAKAIQKERSNSVVDGQIQHSNTVVDRNPTPVNVPKPLQLKKQSQPQPQLKHLEIPKQSPVQPKIIQKPLSEDEQKKLSPQPISDKYKSQENEIDQQNFSFDRVKGPSQKQSRTEACSDNFRKAADRANSASSAEALSYSDFEINHNQTGTLTIEVVDCGIGVSKENQKNLFRPFEQANKSIAKRFGGTGLGLWISRQMIEVMNGTLTMESKGEGYGSKFTIQMKTEERPYKKKKTRNSSSSVAFVKSETISSSTEQNVIVYVINEKMTFQAIKVYFTPFSQFIQIKFIETIAEMMIDAKKYRSKRIVIFFDEKLCKKVAQESISIECADHSPILIQLKHTLESKIENNLFRRTRSKTENEPKLDQLVDFTIQKSINANEIQMVINEITDVNYFMRKRENKVIGSQSMRLIPAESKSSQILAYAGENAPKKTLSSKSFQALPRVFSFTGDAQRQEQELSEMNRMAQYLNGSINTQTLLQDSPSSDSSQQRVKMPYVNRQNINAPGELTIVNEEKSFSDSCSDFGDKYNSKVMQAALKSDELNQQLVQASFERQIQNKQLAFSNSSKQESPLKGAPLNLFYTPPDQIPFGSICLMVADDVDFIRMSTLKTFEMCLYEAMTKQNRKFKKTYYVEAENGNQAFQLYKDLSIRNCRVALILMDMDMGNDSWSGAESAYHIRKFEKSAQIETPAHIIAHTCDELKVLSANPFFQSVSDFSPKPMPKEGLQKCVYIYEIDAKFQTKFDYSFLDRSEEAIRKWKEKQQKDRRHLNLSCQLDNSRSECMSEAMSQVSYFKSD